MKYFTIQELTKSATAIRRGINNRPSSTVTNALTNLVNNVLDPLREKFGESIIVTSGYRSSELNRIIGGATNSQHTIGEAADIRTVSDSRNDNIRLLKCLLNSGIIFDQVIAENVDSRGCPDWIHVSYTNRRGNRMKRTTMKRINGKTIYSDGIRI